MTDIIKTCNILIEEAAKTDLQALGEMAGSELGSRVAIDIRNRDPKFQKEAWNEMLMNYEAKFERTMGLPRATDLEEIKQRGISLAKQISKLSNKEINDALFKGLCKGAVSILLWQKE